MSLARRLALGAATAILAVILLVGGWMVLEQPRGDRNWVEHLAQMPTIELRGDGFTLGPATDWSYDGAGAAEKKFTTASESFADLKNVWFVMEPHPGMRPMAHTLVLFEFPDDRIIGLTVEARREAHEKYSAFWGLFNRFELAYVWSTARDLLTRRAVFLKHDILVYPLQLSTEQKQAFLRGVLAKTIDVSTRPRFYNTLVSNCTNELAKTAGLGWHYSFVLTGYSDERLFALKLIPGESIAEAREKAVMTDKVRALAGRPAREFDRELLAELRGRHGARIEADAK